MIGDLIYFDSLYGTRLYGVVIDKHRKYCQVYWFDEMYSTLEPVDSLRFVMENKND